MRNQLFRLLGVVVLVITTAAAAEADVCIRIDEARDTLTQSDRTSALLLLAKQFEAEGQRVVSDGCADTYLVSHLRFGDTITVTLTGPASEREAMALGLNDVPAVYSQLVRAILTGQPVGSLKNVVDRTNVIATQAAPMRVQSDSLFYVRLGYGGVGGNASVSGPSMGFGFRRELDAFALDVSFLNVMTDSSGGYSYGGGSTGSWVKLGALRYINRTSNATPYFGGGLSWGGMNVSRDDRYFDGNGLQGELTAGYEILRASNVRMFIQSDVVLPFYSATTHIYRPRMPPLTERRYMPSAMVSIGMGWGKSRGRR
jgi:hypothetical protein